MKRFSIAVIPGDGVGQEVLPAAKTVLQAAGRRFGFEFEFIEFPWGAAYYFEHGRMMPADGLELLRPMDSILLGAIGDPRIPDHVTLNGLLLPIRRGFDQYANVRPAILYRGVSSPLAKPGEIDMVLVRENTEGEYAQVGGFVYHDQPDEVAIQSGVFTRRGIDRVVRFAFELARKRNKKKHVTSVTKSNAQGFGMVLWDRAFRAVASQYPDIETESLLVDAAAMNFIRRPHSFDVVVASNLFGDILSDVSAILTGSIGLAPSANLDPSRRYPSMFEPVHGSAPDIAGQGLVNPMAAILSGGMMLDHLGQEEAGRTVERAVAHVLAAGKIRTPDLSGANRTHEVTEAVLEQIGANYPLKS
jgi:tartrate dehydrogenase/decarboxylase/D-malate dehydrogenase